VHDDRLALALAAAAVVIRVGVGVIRIVRLDRLVPPDAVGVEERGVFG
jgi:hypothetical protein